MPQASDEDRARIRKWFGSIDTTGPEQFLMSHGYSLTLGWQWEKPVPSHSISEDEYHCIRFLVDEWDYGGIARVYSNV